MITSSDRLTSFSTELARDKHISIFLYAADSLYFDTV